ncbi:MAG: co-chaperone GroES [bacterium]|jgi:chaperonin GroES
MNIKPLGNRVVVQLIKQKTTSASGIILTTEEKNEQAMGKIISMGKGADVDGEIELKDLEVKVGDTVLFGRYAGEEVKDESDAETVFKILSSKDILAVIEL